jgi:hypothetical protein
MEKHFKRIVNRSAQKKDNSNSYADAGFHAPVERWYKQEEKIFRPQKRNDFHGRLQPATKALKKNVPSYANIPDGFHREVAPFDKNCFW